jgi:lipopolysaccharide/colanic/teichoic acid biosynthesis glycosyltransferase
MILTSRDPDLQPVADQREAFHPTMQAPGAERNWYIYFKPAMDCCLAVLMLIVSLPIVVLAAIAVKLTSRGPIIYSQTRLGRNGRPYAIYKIRTMYDKCEWKSGICWSTKGDPRITPVGRFLRLTHIDELPQLWNILRGEMSLVGPRPERPEFFPGLEKSVPRYRERLGVRPGITGLAQVQLPADTDIESVRRKLAHDLHYIQILSFWLDLRILVSTTLHVVGLKYWVGRFLFTMPTATATTNNDEVAEDCRQDEEAMRPFRSASSAMPIPIPIPIPMESGKY